MTTAEILLEGIQVLFFLQTFSSFPSSLFRIIGTCKQTSENSNILMSQLSSTSVSREISGPVRDGSIYYIIPVAVYRDLALAPCAGLQATGPLLLTRRLHSQTAGYCQICRSVGK